MGPGRDSCDVYVLHPVAVGAERAAGGATRHRHTAWAAGGRAAVNHTTDETGAEHLAERGAGGDAGARRHTVRSQRIFQRACMLSLRRGSAIKNIGFCLES